MQQRSLVSGNCASTMSPPSPATHANPVTNSWGREGLSGHYKELNSLAQGLKVRP